MRTALPRPFLRLAGANLAAQSAEQLSLAAVPLLAVLALHAGPGEIGLLAAVQTLPFLLLSIPLGLLADRWSRQRLMVLAEALRALSLLGLLGVAVSASPSIAWLAVLGFAGAVGTVGFSVAAPALVPSLVGRAALAQANGRLELARSAAFAAGPSLGGALVAWLGAPVAFVLAALLSLQAVALLLRIAEPARTQAPARHPVAELREGAAFVWQHALLRPILLTAMAWNLSWFVLQAAYVPHAVRALGLGAEAVGLTLGACGAGMVAGALLSPRILRSLPLGRAIQLGPALSVLAALAMVATLAWPSGLLAALAMFLFGVGPIVWVIASTTLRQTVTPQQMLGRVSALFLTANAGMRPLGAALGGAVGAAWGEPACLLLAMAGFGLQAWLILASPMRGLRALPTPA
ncbi:MFS transporter [Variovorax sp. JS1663]|uniref:MFS transporter n=1 Tax=Variovorax sp. JS1663 TaxID=1851577 RepID=UPI000B343B52|nr:MFS transporter [Variovorax sp. JS1663]OUL99085.1 MFS transporter [Variovorax sp. JS1663]